MNYSREMLKEFDKKEDIIDNINSINIEDKLTRKEIHRDKSKVDF